METIYKVWVYFSQPELITTDYKAALFCWNNHLTHPHTKTRIEPFMEIERPNRDTVWLYTREEVKDFFKDTGYFNKKEENRVIKRLKAEEEEKHKDKLPTEDRNYHYYVVYNDDEVRMRGPYTFQFAIDSLNWEYDEGDFQNVATDGYILAYCKDGEIPLAELRCDLSLDSWEGRVTKKEEERCFDEQEKKVEMIEQEHDGMEIVEPVETPLEFRTDATGVVNGITWIGDQEVKKVKASEVDFHGDFGDMNDEQQDAIINPAHYKMIPPEAYEKFPEGLEYMDLMEYILAHHTGVEAHALGQIFRYACRLGKKDADLQDAKKIEWYAKYLVNTIKGRS